MEGREGELEAEADKEKREAGKQPHGVEGDDPGDGRGFGDHDAIDDTGDRGGTKDEPLAGEEDLVHAQLVAEHVAGKGDGASGLAIGDHCLKDALAAEDLRCAGCAKEEGDAQDQEGGGECPEDEVLEGGLATAARAAVHAHHGVEREGEDLDADEGDEEVVGDAEHRHAEDGEEEQRVEFAGGEPAAADDGRGHHREGKARETDDHGAKVPELIGAEHAVEEGAPGASKHVEIEEGAREEERPAGEVGQDGVAPPGGHGAEDDLKEGVEGQKQDRGNQQHREREHHVETDSRDVGGDLLVHGWWNEWSGRWVAESAVKEVEFLDADVTS